MGRFDDPVVFLKRDAKGKMRAPPGLTKEQREAHEKSAAAWEHWHETGDDSKLREAGLID